MPLGSAQINLRKQTFSCLASATPSNCETSSQHLTPLNSQKNGDDGFVTSPMNIRLNLESCHRLTVKLLGVGPWCLAVNIMLLVLLVQALLVFVLSTVLLMTRSEVARMLTAN